MNAVQKKQKLRKIESLKKVLQAEYKEFRCYNDSYNIRYSIAEIYFEIGAHSKTSKYLNWFNRSFPNDVTYSSFQLAAAVAYFETKSIRKAFQAIIKLNALNLYVVDLLIGNPVKDHNKYELSESETLKSAKEQFEDLLKLTSPNFNTWLTKIHSEIDYQTSFKEYLSILKLIKGLEVSEERSNLLNESIECIEKWAFKYKTII